MGDFNEEYEEYNVFTPADTATDPWTRLVGRLREHQQTSTPKSEGSSRGHLTARPPAGIGAAAKGLKVWSRDRIELPTP